MLQRQTKEEEGNPEGDFYNTNNKIQLYLYFSNILGYNYRGKGKFPKGSVVLPRT